MSAEELQTGTDAEQVKSSEPRETVNELDQSYTAIVKRQFKKNKPAVWSLRFVFVIVIFGLSSK